MNKNKKLSLSFYQRKDVVQIAKELLGKVLVTNFDNNITSGMIVETEAYAGIGDKASHAFGGRRTNRTQIMYNDGGCAYVYLCYGIHHLFNVITNKREIPHAVLIRAVEPVEGIDIMMKRRKKKTLDLSLTRGPGSTAMALGFHTSHTGMQLDGECIWIENRHNKIPENKISCGPRVGVAYAGEHASLPYRFWVNGNKYVSKFVP